MNGEQINRKARSPYRKKLGYALGSADFLLLLTIVFLIPKPKLLGSIEVRTMLCRVFFE